MVENGLEKNVVDYTSRELIREIKFLYEFLFNSLDFSDEEESVKAIGSMVTKKIYALTNELYIRNELEDFCSDCLETCELKEEKRKELEKEWQKTN